MEWVNITHSAVKYFFKPTCVNVGSMFLEFKAAHKRTPHPSHFLFFFFFWRSFLGAKHFITLYFAIVWKQITTIFNQGQPDNNILSNLNNNTPYM